MYFSDFASKKYVVEAKYCVYVIFSRLNEAERSRIDKKHVPFHLLPNDTDTVSQS